MKFWEWVLVLGGLAAGGVLMAFVAIVALLPYVAVGAVILVCARYLGWF